MKLSFLPSPCWKRPNNFEYRACSHDCLLYSFTCHGVLSPFTTTPPHNLAVSSTNQEYLPALRLSPRSTLTFEPHQIVVHPGESARSCRASTSLPQHHWEASLTLHHILEADIYRASIPIYVGEGPEKNHSMERARCSRPYIEGGADAASGKPNNVACLRTLKRIFRGLLMMQGSIEMRRPFAPASM